MTPEIREQLRLRILLLLEAAGSLGMRTNTLMIEVTGAGFRASLKEISDELAYLVDKKLSVEVPQAVSPELKRWRITAEGRDFLATQGLL